MEIVRFKDKDCLSDDECKCTTEADCGIKKWYLDEDSDGYHAKGSEPKEQVESPGENWVEGVSGGEDCDDSDADVRDECNDCTNITCGENEALNEDKCECIPSNCEYRTGYLHEGAFTNNTASVGNNTTVSEDNFRDANGAVINTNNCNTGKINTNSQVKVTGAKETRTFIRSNGTTGTSQYYPIEYIDCGKGNRPGTLGYDPSKPCSDCNSADPIKKIQILGSKGSGIKGGMFGLDARKYANGNPKAHTAYDIDMPVGTEIFNMFEGKVVEVQTSHKDLGKWIIVESTVAGKKVQIWYSHLSKVNVTKNQIIDRNTIVGKSGKSGNAGNPGSAGPHLHLVAREIINGKWKKVDPGKYLSSTINTTTGKGTSPCE